MRRLIVPLVAALALLPVAPAFAAGPAGVTSFHWEAPADFTGALAARMTFDFGASQHCVFRSQVSGTTLEGPVHSWEEFNGRGGAFYSGYTAQAHASFEGQSVDTREVIPKGDGVWSLTSTRTGPHEGTLEYTLVVVHGGAWTREATGYHAPLLVDVTCDEPFTVSGFKAGREAFGFTLDHMDGGSGASAGSFMGQVTVAQGDRAAHTFTTGEEVTFSARYRGYGYPSTGTLTLDTPEGTEAHDLGADVSVRHVGTPGEYAVTVDLVAVGLANGITGFGYSLSPVASLDDAV